MRIAVFGLGYVGTVTGACFAKLGHDVIGVDRNEVKIDFINKGQSPVIEKEIPELIAAASRGKRFRATRDTTEAVTQSDLSFVCVGTPSKDNGSLDLTSISNVCEEVGTALKEKNRYHTIVFRSTMLPGSTEHFVIPRIERASGLTANKDFGVCFNPEFMREGSSVNDFFHPPFTIIGSCDQQTVSTVEDLYESVKVPLIHTNYQVAEMVKYVCNSFHALKITFANEIGRVCKDMEIDAHDVMDIVCLDTKLNISKAYLKPGFAFGGSCLPKDLRAILYKAKMSDLDVPLLASILPSNRSQIQGVIDRVLRFQKKRIGLVGLSFKAGTDDLRESPLVVLAESLIGKGYQLKIYDENIMSAKLIGSNKEYIQKEIPHLSSILTPDLRELIETSEVIILGNADDSLHKCVDRFKTDQVVIDLARALNNEVKGKHGFEYHGLYW